MDPQLMKQEIADARTVGLRVNRNLPASWECELNHFPGVLQQCRFTAWEIGNDGRIRPRVGWRVGPGESGGRPRLKVNADAQEHPRHPRLALGGQPFPAPTLPRVSVTNGDVVMARLAALEARMSFLESRST